MEGGNWRPAGQGDAGGAPPAGNWRLQLQPEVRQQIVNKIMETLERHLQIPESDGLNELNKIATRFEEKIYTAATSQTDYLRRISLKMLPMETKTQNPVAINQPSLNPAGGNQSNVDPASLGMQSQVGNPGQSLPIGNQSSLQPPHLPQNLPNNILGTSIQGSASMPTQMSTISGIPQSTLPNASLDSTTQTGNAGVVDWQEEIYQKIKSMKELYFAELNEPYQKLLLKFQQYESQNLLPDAKQMEQIEKMKHFKVMLERAIHFLQIPKSSINPAVKEKLPLYQKQIITFLATNRKPRNIPPQSQFQPPGGHTQSTPQQQSSQVSQLQQHDSYVNQVQQMNLQASLDSTAQTGNAGVVDWQEEIYQKIKSMKELYFAELNELYQKLLLKFQQCESQNLLPHAKQTEQIEKMKSYKVMLERSIHFLQIPKSSIQPALKEKLPLYQKQISTFLATNRKPRNIPPQSQLLQMVSHISL